MEMRVVDHAEDRQENAIRHGLVHKSCRSGAHSHWLFNRSITPRDTGTERRFLPIVNLVLELHSFTICLDFSSSFIYTRGETAAERKSTRSKQIKNPLDLPRWLGWRKSYSSWFFSLSSWWWWWWWTEAEQVTMTKLIIKMATVIFAFIFLPLDNQDRDYRSCSSCCSGRHAELVDGPVGFFLLLAGHTTWRSLLNTK